MKFRKMKGIQNADLVFDERGSPVLLDFSLEDELRAKSNRCFVRLDEQEEFEIQKLKPVFQKRSRKQWMTGTERCLKNHLSKQDEGLRSHFEAELEAVVLQIEK